MPPAQDPKQRTLDLERLASYTPLAIAIYFAVQLAVRLLLSSNLEIDESQFVGALHWAWGYPNSHPPLYNWLVILFVGAFRYWPAIAILKYLLLAATFAFLYDTARRASGSRITGAAAALSLTLVYQVIWQSQITLAHSVLSLAAVAGTMHALVLVLQQGRPRDFVWLGLALSTGLLSKYNFALFLGSIGVAIAALPDCRRAIWRPGLWLTIALIAAAVAPHLLWGASHSDATTARLFRLGEDSFFSRLGVPLRGVDGLCSLAWALVSAVGPMVLGRCIAGRWSAGKKRSADALAHTEESAQPSQGNVRKLCAHTILVAIGACVVAVIAADLHSIPERYATPLLIPFAIWLALACPLARQPNAARKFGQIAVAAALTSAFVLPIPALFGTHSFAFPYEEMTAEIQTFAKPPFAILASRREHAANIAIRAPGAAIFAPGIAAERVLVVWTDRDGEKPDFVRGHLGAAYSPAGPVRVLRHRYAFFSGKEARLFAQVWEGTP